MSVTLITDWIWYYRVNYLQFIFHSFILIEYYLLKTKVTSPRFVVGGITVVVLLCQCLDGKYCSQFSAWGYEIQCKIAYTSGTKGFCILIPLRTKPELVPFFPNASSAAILNFKMAAIFSLFWAVFVPKSYKVIFFLMIVTTYDCQNPLRTSFDPFPRIQDGRQIQNGLQSV